MAVKGWKVAELFDLIEPATDLQTPEGTLDVFAEFTAANGRILGGVKPVAKNVKVRPTEDDFGNKLKAWLADKGLRLFSDRVPDRNAVVTIIPINGRLDHPDMQLWPTVLGVVRNSFVEGISSGFTHLPPQTADKPQGKLEQIEARSNKDEGPPRAQPRADARRREQDVTRGRSSWSLRRSARLRPHQDHRRGHGEAREEDQDDERSEPRSRGAERPEGRRPARRPRRVPVATAPEALLAPGADDRFASGWSPAVSCGARRVRRGDARGDPAVSARPGPAGDRRSGRRNREAPGPGPRQDVPPGDRQRLNTSGQTLTGIVTGPPVFPLLSRLGRDLHLSGGMKTNTFLTGTGAVMALALGGCGSVSGIPIEKTATDFAKAICPKAYDCCTTETRMPNMSAGTTEAECETLTAKDFRNSLQNMQASENAGRAKYDQEQVDACLEAIRAATCSQLTTIRSLAGLPECNSTFATPLVEIGGTCGQDYECKNSVCQKAPMAWEGRVRRRGGGQRIVRHRPLRAEPDLRRQGHRRRDRQRLRRGAGKRRLLQHRLRVQEPHLRGGGRRHREDVQRADWPGLLLRRRLLRGRRGARYRRAAHHGRLRAGCTGPFAPLGSQELRKMDPDRIRIP
jgi:hypothetical protein